MAGIAAFLNVDVFACRTTGPVSLSMELRSPWSIPCPYTPWKHCTFVCIKCSLRYGIFGWMFLPSAVSCCWDNLRDGRANQFMTYSMGESWSRGGGHSHILTVRVCAAHKGSLSRLAGLSKGYLFHWSTRSGAVLPVPKVHSWTKSPILWFYRSFLSQQISWISFLSPTVH